MATITSRHNPLAQRLRRLADGGASDGLMRLEGVTLIEEALAAGIQIVEVAVSEGLAATARGRQLLALLGVAQATIRLFDDRLLASLSALETGQGVLAVARRPTIQEDRVFRPVPLVVVGVSLQNPGNAGGLLRTAEAAGATGVYLTAGSADPLSWKALRGSMGSAFRLPLVHGLDAGEVLARVRRRGLVSIATLAEGGQRYDAIDWTRPLALWLGNEGAGLDTALARSADERATIPMAPPVESLNVAVAAGILLFEAARQRRSRPAG